MKVISALLMVLTMASLSSAQTQTPADVIFINGDIYPGELPKLPGMFGAGSPAPSRVPREDDKIWTESVPGPKSRFNAIAVTNGKIVAIGIDTEGILKLKGPNTEVIDLDGKFVMPGFNDAHVHLASGGFEKLDINLTGTKSVEEMRQRIAARAQNVGAGEWLLGRGWDQYPME